MTHATMSMPDVDLPSVSHTAAPKGGRVLVYGMNYAPEIAGVGKYTGEIAEHLAEEGMAVTVVSTPPHYPGWSVQPGYRNRYSTAIEKGVRVLRAPLVLKRNMRGIWRLIAPLTFALSSAPVVFWQILRHRPLTVFCVEPTLFAAPVAQLAASLVGARTLLHVQDLEVDAAFAVGHLGSKPWLKKLGYAFEKFTLKRFDHVITISNRMADKLVEKGVARDDVSVIRNWVDLSHIYPMDTVSPYRAELGFSDEDFVVLYSGNMGAKQGLNILLDAAEKLRDEPHVKFVVAGEGPVKAELQSRYGQCENVRFLPFQPYARLNEFLNMADLHALPQDKGAADLVLPSKLGGMLASGKQVLVTAEKQTELADFVDEIGLVVEPGDADAMAGEIRRCAMRDDLPCGSRVEALGRLSKEAGLKEMVSAVAPARHA